MWKTGMTSRILFLDEHKCIVKNGLNMQVYSKFEKSLTIKNLLVLGISSWKFAIF